MIFKNVNVVIQGMISVNKLIFATHSTVLAIKEELVIPLLILFLSKIVIKALTANAVLKKHLVFPQLHAKANTVSVYPPNSVI